MPVFVEYRDIAGYPGYQVGTDGSIRKQVTEHFWKHLSNITNSDGYAVINLTNQAHRKTQRMIHVLVLETFVGPRPKWMQGCHNNGVRFDCRLDNLRWDTPVNNEADKIKHGTIMRGSRNPQYKLTTDQVYEIRGMLAEGVPAKAIARQFGVSGTAINAIRHRRNYGWLE